MKIIYRPIKMALTPEGRVYLEAHPNIYDGSCTPWNRSRTWRSITISADRIDWDKVTAILKTKEGLAQDITKAGGCTQPLPPPDACNAPKEVGFPLYRAKAAR